MGLNTRRNFFSKLTAITALVTGAPKLFAQQPGSAATPMAGAGASPNMPGRSGITNHTHEGIFYFYGTGSNDGYGKDDHVTVTDPFEKHVTGTMDALKKSVERAGTNMDSLIHLDVFMCLPHADSIP